MEPKWSDYTQVGVEQGFGLYQRKSKDGKGPRFAFRSTFGTFKGAWGRANNLTDIKIQVDEYLKFHIGLGISTGYRMGGGPTMEPEEIYRKVGIGRYLFRDNAVDLLPYMALVIPYKSREHVPFFIDNAEVVEGKSIEQVRKNIDRAIEGYPKIHQKHFAD